MNFDIDSWQVQFDIETCIWVNEILEPRKPRLWIIDYSSAQTVPIDNHQKNYELLKRVLECHRSQRDSIMSIIVPSYPSPLKVHCLWGGTPATKFIPCYNFKTLNSPIWSSKTTLKKVETRWIHSIEVPEYFPRPSTPWSVCSPIPLLSKVMLFSLLSSRPAKL